MTKLSLPSDGLKQNLAAADLPATRGVDAFDELAMDPMPSAAVTPMAPIKDHKALVAGLIGLAVVFAIMRQGPLYSDEPSHWRQIDDFVRGYFHMRVNITTLPGYHAAVAAGLWLIQARDAMEARLVSSFFTLCAIFVWHRVAQRADPENADVKFLQLSFLPIAVPYDFLLFTDIFSLGLLMAALWAVLADRRLLAALAITATFAVRQTNIIWIAFFALYDLSLQGYTWKTLLQKASLKAEIKRLWPYVIPALAFLVFMIINGGVAVGDRQAHHLGIYPGNFFFCLGLITLFFFPSLPALVADRSAWRQQVGKLFLCLGIGVIASLCLARVSHPYNHVRGFLRNDTLAWFHASWQHKAVYGLVIGMGAWIVWLTPVRHKVALALVGSLYLLAHPLIEQRYAIPLLALFIIFRTCQNRRWEWVMLGWFVLMASLFLSVIRALDYSL